ncbi:26S proteasome non-ATPase regulatory subunit, partial [Trifolium pratense]
MCFLSGVPPLPGSESSRQNCYYRLLPYAPPHMSGARTAHFFLARKTLLALVCLSLQGLLQFFCKMSMGFPHYAAQFCAKIVISSIDGRLQSLEDPSNRDEFETALESLGQIGL